MLHSCKTCNHVSHLSRLLMQVQLQLLLLYFTVSCAALAWLFVVQLLLGVGMLLLLLQQFTCQSDPTPQGTGRRRT
jgi:hypothetical protein